jgi:hypothetical protein
MTGKTEVIDWFELHYCMYKPKSYISIKNKLQNVLMLTYHDYGDPGIFPLFLMRTFRVLYPLPSSDERVEWCSAGSEKKRHSYSLTVWQRIGPSTGNEWMSVYTNFHPRKSIFTSQNKHCVTLENDTIETEHKRGNPKFKFCYFKSVEVMPTPNPNFQRYKAGCSVMMFCYLTRK